MDRPSNIFLIISRSIFVTLLAWTSVCGKDASEVDILILGAGMAGITAGNHFQNNGQTNFLILEAQDYTGGRVKQFYIGNVTVGEGANWVHYVEEGDKNPMLKFAKEINLARYLNNHSDFNLRNSIHSKADFKETLKKFEEIQAKVVKENEDNPRNGDEPLSSVLALNGWIPDTPLKRTVEWTLDFEYALKPALISASFFAGLPEKDEIVTDHRGFKGIIEHLAQNITSKIKMNKIVTQIKYGSNGIEVRAKDGETYKAKYGICTFSTGVLASDLVEFVPELPKWKKEAISKIPLAYFTNIFVKFPTAFWEDNEFIFNAGSISSTFPLVYNLNKKGIQKGSNILLFVAVEDNSLRIESQSKNKTKDEVMKTLGEMYPNVSIPQPTELYVGQFNQNPYVRGSFSNAVVGTTSADFHNLQGRLGDLFFSGEATDDVYWGYTQGSYFSGLKQAKAILSCLNGKECPEYKPKDVDICRENNISAPSAGNIETSSPTCFFLIILYTLFNSYNNFL